MNVTIAEILQNYQDPYLNKTWGQLKVIQQVQLTAGELQLDIVLPYPAAGLQSSLCADLQKHLKDITEIQRIHVNLSSRIVPHTTQPNVQAIPGVRNVIAVASGKGGVGKSTTAVNLAMALRLDGASVGILDADIYGPNQPHMLGVTERLSPQNGQAMSPIRVHGIQSMSIGYLIDPTTPMIWRGPMVSSALQQLARETTWDNLDYLVIDLPPGTGDIQLTLAQKIPVTGAVIVTTPQDIALLDARKALEMFHKVQVHVLGIMENMSTHICRHCGHEEAIFGTGGALSLADVGHTELLAQLPLDIRIREQADYGLPVTLAEPEGRIAGMYRQAARRLAAKLALQPQSYNSKLPKISVEK